MFSKCDSATPDADSHQHRALYYAVAHKQVARRRGRKYDACNSNRSVAIGRGRTRVCVPCEASVKYTDGTPKRCTLRHAEINIHHLRTSVQLGMAGKGVIFGRKVAMPKLAATFYFLIETQFRL